jgi:Cdc6-like AAA superfamily ATPase
MASASEGDSRVAISTLRIVAEDAENQDLEKVPDSLIDKALSRAMVSSTERTMDMLSQHQRLLMDIIMLEENMDGGELFKKFTKVSKQRGLPDITDRTFRNHMDKLSQLGLVEPEGRGRWKSYSLKVPKGSNGNPAPG